MTEARMESRFIGTEAAALRRTDLLWLALAVGVLIASGIGLREPWPADEPRFALLARDMVLTGDWLFPRVGGDLYPDKPLFYFWLLAAGYAITGSIRWSFLLPSLIAACGVVGLIYDLARRLVDRRAALGAALTLAFTVQFLMVMRAAQIDATLCLLTTLSLYGLLRHLLLGPQWGWFFAGGLAAGVGVITKGVGFLPLLVLIPYVVLRARGFQPLPRFEGGAKWGLVAVGFLLGVSIWLVPMLIAVATRNDPALVAYRNEILFHQTVTRYASSWHHIKPWYFFIVEVIPALWLPVSVLLIWLVPRWRAALRERDARVWLPLGWALLVLIFFSSSPGKRGIYIMPALPAVVLAASPFLTGLFDRRAVQRASVVLGGIVVAAVLGLLIAHAFGAKGLDRAMGEAGLSSVTPIAVLGVLATTAWIIAWRWRPLLAWPAVLASLALVWSFGVNPLINGERSAHNFMRQVLAQLPPESELAFMAYKEQFLLYVDRPVTNFGHRRWREGPKEAQDAARWLNAAPNRVLLAPEAALKPCFAGSPHIVAGRASDQNWLLIRAPAAEDCASLGDSQHEIVYQPPSAR
jgi:4-amino-4-deoxy-L-arabinose transferase-like glycosyltransferase